MRTRFFLFLFASILALTSCNETPPVPERPEGLLNHTIMDEEVDDSPLKTQVSFKVVINDKAFDKGKLEELLTYLYESTKTRTGFKYNETPTNIYIWAFSTKEKAQADMGQWVGMISKDFNDIEPEIDLSDTEFRALTEKQEDKWGLSYETRQDIWIQLINAERNAQREADKTYPLNHPGITQDDMARNIGLMRDLKERYESDIAKEYNLEMAVLDSVSLEGVMNGWAFPERQSE